MHLQNENAGRSVVMMVGSSLSGLNSNCIQARLNHYRAADVVVATAGTFENMMLKVTATLCHGPFNGKHTILRWTVPAFGVLLAWPLRAARAYKIDVQCRAQSLLRAPRLWMIAHCYTS